MAADIMHNVLGVHPETIFARKTTKVYPHIRYRNAAAPSESTEISLNAFILFTLSMKIHARSPNMAPNPRIFRQPS